MAEILAGDVLVKLRADTAQFAQALNDVIARLTQLNQAGTQAASQQRQGQQSTAQLAQAYGTLSQAVTQQAQAMTQANQASLQQVQASRASTQATTQQATASQQLLQSVRQTQQGMATLTQALTQQTTASQASTQAIASLTQQLQSLHATQQQGTQVTTQATSAWQGLLSVAGGIGIATSIQGLVSSMIHFGESVVTAGTQLQTLRASLANVSGGIQQGQQAFTFITDTANRYGLSLQTLAGSYRSLLAATRGTALEGQDTQRLFTALAGASRTYGLTTEQTGRALTAFQQIISKGVVSQEELRQQLGEALPGAMQIAARAFGVTTAALNDMITKGIDSTEFVRRFTTQLTTELPKGTQNVETAAQAFNRLGNEILQLKEHIANSGLLQFLADVAGRLASILEATRKADEQQKTAAQTRASQAAGFPVQPADAEKLLAVTEKLTQAEDELRGLQTARQQGAFGPLTGLIATDAQIAQAQKTVDTLRQQQTELAALAKAREGTRQGVTARMEGVEGGDPLREQQERARDAEAANQRLKTLLDQTDTSLKQLTDQAKETPQVFGNLTGNAEQKIEFLDNRIKILRENLEKITTAIVARPNVQGLPAPELQAQKTDLAAQLTQAEAQKKAIEDALEAQKRAEREADQSRKKALRDAEADAKAAVTQAIQLDATLERLRGLTRRPDENKAEEAATRVRSQYAAAIAEGEKAIVELERSAALQAKRPEALEQYKAVVAALRQAGEEQAKLASDEVLKRQIKPLEDLALKYGLVTKEITGQSGRVQELASKYGLATKEALDLYEAEKLAASFKGTERQAEAEEYLKTIKETIAARQAIEAQVPLLEQQARASFGEGFAAVQAVPVTSDLERQLELLRTPREERVSTRARQKAERASGGVLTEEQEALIRQIEAQERVNKITQMAEQIGDQAAQTITSGLLKIVDGTVRVGEGFRNMAKEILDSIAEITLNETFKTLIRFGLGLATTALTGALTPAAAESGPSTLGPSSSFIGGILGSQFESGFQHGGVVNRPTHAMLGENPGMNPEFIVNHPQMKALMSAAMQAAPSAGGQAAGGDVSVILVDNRGQAEREAAAQRGMGRQVIIQEVVRDLSQGSGSTIGRMIKAGGH